MTKKRYQILAKCYDSKNHLLSSAQNNYSKTHPVQAHFAHLANQSARIYLHAEILAILRAGDKKIHTITIQNLNGTLSNPCPVCMKAIQAYGIKRVISLSSL